MASPDVSDELPCSRRFVPVTSVTGVDIFREPECPGDSQYDGCPQQTSCHQQQYPSPPRATRTMKCNSLSPSWLQSNHHADSFGPGDLRRAASAPRMDSPSAFRNDPKLTPRPQTSPAHTQTTATPRPCISPTVPSRPNRRVLHRDEQLPSFSHAESLKEVFDTENSKQSPHTPGPINHSTSLRLVPRLEAPSHLSSASPYTSHLEGQVRQLEKRNQCLESKLREAMQQMQLAEEQAGAHASQLAQKMDEFVGLSQDLQGMRREHDRLSGLLLERDAALRHAEDESAAVGRERDDLRSQLQHFEGLLHNNQENAAAHVEKMEAQGQHLHGALEELQQERDAAVRERDAVVHERDSALQHGEEMLGDLKALLSKNQELEADNEQLAQLLVSARRERDAVGQERDEAAAALQTSCAEAKNLRQQAAEAMRRAHDSATENAHAQATIRSRDADLRDLEAQISTITIAQRGSGRTAQYTRSHPAYFEGGNDLEQGLAAPQVGWADRLTPRMTPRPRPPMGRYFDRDYDSGPLVSSTPERGDRLQTASQSMMEFQDDSHSRSAKHPAALAAQAGSGAEAESLRRGGGKGAALRPGGAASDSRAKGHAADGGPGAQRGSTSPPQSLSVREQQELEAELLQLNTQRDALEAEYAKMPPHSGRTLQQRQRKAAVEHDLAAVEKGISSVRLTLKRCGFR